MSLDNELFEWQHRDDLGNDLCKIVTPTKWPDLTAHQRAWDQAKRELRGSASLRELIRRAHEILREAPQNAVPIDSRPHQG